LSFNKPLSPNRRFTGSVPNLGGTGGLDLRREAYGWIRWNEVSSCEVVGGEKALKSSGFISKSGIAENSLKILFLFNFQQKYLRTYANSIGQVKIVRFV
jgi:hypothetical protein